MNKNARFGLAVGILLAIILKSLAGENSVMVSLNFRNAPLYQVIQFYEQFTGWTATVERAEYPVFTLRPDRRLTRDEAISSIETNLAAIGIIFDKSPEGIRVHPDPGRMPKDVERTLYAPPGDITSKTSSPPSGYYLQRRHQREIIQKSLPSIPKEDESD